MITIYDLLEVDENATIEEIEKSYSRLILEFHQAPNLDEKTNQENELILKKMKMAYEILKDDDKRKQYDQDLANRRAESLIKNVSISEQTDELKKDVENTNSDFNQNIADNIPLIENEKIQDENLLTDDEKSKLRKAAKKDFHKNLKRAKLAEDEYNQAYQEAYHQYLRKMGYQVKDPWTLKRISNIVITILVFIGSAFIVWHIPPIKNVLIHIYESNFIVHALVNLITIIMDTIFSIFQ